MSSRTAGARASADGTKEGRTTQVKAPGAGCSPGVLGANARRGTQVQNAQRTALANANNNDYTTFLYFVALSFRLMAASTAWTPQRGGAHTADL